MALLSQASHVRSHFKHPDLVAIMEWPVLFLGGSPKNVPAMYSLMNYAAVQLGTWFPVGGMAQVPIGMANLARELGVKFHCGEEFAVDRIVVDSDTASKCQKQRGGRPMASGVQTRAGFFEADFVVAAGDYHHMVRRKTLDTTLFVCMRENACTHVLFFLSYSICLYVCLCSYLQS